MKIIDSTNPNDEFIADIGPKDKVVVYNTNYPIYVLHNKDENGLWSRLQDKITELGLNETLQTIKQNDIDEYMWKESGISFETDIF